MLEDPGDEIGEFVFHLEAVDGLVAGEDAAMTSHFSTQAGNAEATFPPFEHFRRPLQDLRIDHHFGLHERSVGIASDWAVKPG